MRRDRLGDRVVALAKSRSQAVATRRHLLVALLEDYDVNPPRWQGHLEHAERSLSSGTSIDPPVVADDVEDLLDQCSDAPGALAVAERLIAEFSDLGDLPDNGALEEETPSAWSEGSDPYAFKIDADDFFCLSSAHRSVVRQIEILNEAVDPSRGDVTLKVSVETATGEPLLHPYEREIPALQIGETKSFRDIRMPPNFVELATLDEQLPGNLLVEVSVGSEVVGRYRKQISFLAYNQWMHNPQNFDSLSAFVHPNHPSLAPVITRTRELLGERTENPSTEGYQDSGNKERWLAMAEAVYDALCELDLTYSDPPASFEGFGQKVRTPDRVLEEHAATCLDSAVLLASCLEAVGLDSVLILVRGHAFAGLLMGDHVAGVMEAMDPRGGVVPNPNDILDLYSNGRFVPIETTTITVGKKKTFAEAIEATTHYFTRSGTGRQHLHALVVPEGCYEQRPNPVRPLPARRLAKGVVVGLDVQEPQIKPGRGRLTRGSEASDLYAVLHFKPASMEALDSDLGLLDLLPALAAATRVEEIIHETLAVETPIHGDRLAKIVGRRCGMARVSAARAKQILDLVPAGFREETGQGLFVWGSGWAPDDYTVFRVTPRGVTDRQINHIASQEILNAAVHVLESGFTGKPEELIKETNRALGFARCGSKVRYRIGAVLAAAADTEILISDGTGYRIPTD